LTGKQLSVAFPPNLPHDEGMPIDRASLEALRNLISDASLTLETTPDLPQNRTANCRESLAAALALSEDLLKQIRTSAGAVLGRKGGSATARKLGVEHYRQMAAARKTHGGGRPRKTDQ
jgi:hypothetical protein